MKPVIACVCFVTRGQEVLLLKRNHPPFIGLFDGLGGHVEDGESPTDAARREVFEESGLAVVPACRGQLSLHNDVSGQVISAHLFAAESQDTVLRTSEEGLPEWVHLDRVPGLPLLGFVHTTMPLVLTPDSWLSGTIWHDDAGNPSRYLLEHRTASRTTILKSD